MIDPKIKKILKHPDRAAQADVDAVLAYVQSAQGEKLSFLECKRCLFFLRGKLPNTDENNRLLSGIYVKATTKAVAPRSVISEAEQTPQSRRAYVEELRKTKPKKVKAAETKLRFYLHQSRKAMPKPDEDTICDLLFYNLAYSMDYISYFGYGYPDKGVADRNEYILEKERWVYGLCCNGYLEAGLLMDKYKTYQILQAFFKREMIPVRSFGDYKSFRAFVERQPQFIRKISNFGGGIGVKRVDLRNKALRGLRASLLFGYYMFYIHVVQRFLSVIIRILTGHNLTKASLVMEELIIQGEAVARFNPSSVNTVRAVGFKTKTDGAHLAFACLRMGRSGSLVDNAHSGGIFADIDPKTGVICSDAMDDYGKVFPCHPDTGVVLKGAPLPEWDKLTEIVVALSEKMEHMQYFGWDLAYSDKGWVLVEGNSAAGMDIHQEVAGHGLRALYFGKQADMETTYATPAPGLFIGRGEEA